MAMFTSGFSLVIVFSSVVSAAHFSSPTSCDDQETWFNRGITYSYKYQLDTRNGISPLDQSSHNHHVTCDIILDVPNRCEMVLSSDNCAIRTSLDVVDVDKSAQLKAKMEQYPAYFKFNKGEVIDSEIFLHKLDPLPIKNLKRGIISMLQLKMFSTKEQYESPSHYNDVLGSCVTHTKLVPGNGHQMETDRDLAFCNHTGPGQYQDSLFSLDKSVRNGGPAQAITQLINPVESNVNCQYKITPDLSMEVVKCLQRHLYSPMLFSGHLATTVSQTLELVSKDTLRSGVFQRDLPEYEIVSLAMNFDDDDEPDVAEDALDNSLERCVMDLVSNDVEDATPAKQFNVFVSQLRNAQEQIIRSIKTRTFSCRSNENCFKSVTPETDPAIAQRLKKKCFVSGLMSCDSGPCHVVLAEMFKDNLISSIDTMHILLNMGLAYRANVKVAEKIHDYCLNDTRSVQCWLSLSAMLSRLEVTGMEEKKQGDLLWTKVVEDLQGFIGTKCQQQSMNVNGAHKRMREHSILTALKGLNNIGRLPDGFQGKSDLAATLMDCVINNQDDVIISHNAVKTLSKMGFLDGPSSDRLMTILQDDNGEMTLRTAIFDAFVVQERREMLRQLLSMLETTKLDTMKTYIATKVVSILESPDPSLFGLQTLLQDLLTDKALPDVKKILSKSHYAEMSHYFTIPLTPFKVGASIGVMVIFNPASNFFQTFTVRTGLVLNGKSLDVSEITVYLEGCDTLMDLVQDFKENPTRLFQAEDFLKMLHVYIDDMAKGKTPTFENLDAKLVKRITEIFTTANMRKATFPRLLIAIKILDYDVVFISSDSVLEHLQESKQYLGKGLIRTLVKNYQTFLVSASKITDFHQTIPSIAGLPTKFELDSTLVARAALKSKGKLEHKANKWNKEFTFDWSLVPGVSISQGVKMDTRLPGYYDTSLTHETWINGLVPLATRVKTRPQLFQKHPLFSVDIIKTVDQNPFSFLSARSETFLSVNGVRQPCSFPESSTRAFDRCLPDVYTKMFGHRICIRGSHDDQTPATRDPSSAMPLLGSARMSGVIIPTDKRLKRFIFNGNYKTTWASTSGYRVYGKFEGKGSELSRSVVFSLQRTMPHGSPNYDSQVILEDADLVFSAHSLDKKIDHTYTKEMAVSVTHDEFTTHSISYLLWKTIDWKTNVERESMIKANVTMAGGDLALGFSRRKTNNSFTSKTDFVELKYHCKPSLPLLYGLHPNPAIASTSGHTSTFTLVVEADSSKTSFVDTWTGTYKDVLSIPGHHISHTSRFVADVTGANRTTNVTWTVGRKQHIYSMIGHVKNKTLPGLNKYDYKMSLVKMGDYVTGLAGHVMWAPKGGFTLRGDIDYQSLASNANGAAVRRKRSLSSILRELRDGEQKLEKIAVRSYAAAKTGLWTIWNGKDNSVPKSGTKNGPQSELQTLRFRENKMLKKIEKSFLALPKWDLSFNVVADLKPDIVKTPLGMKLVGMGCDWRANVTTHGDEETLFQTSGNVYKGRRFKATGSVQEHIHHTAILARMEHENTDELFYHYHKWRLIQNGGHADSTNCHVLPSLNNHPNPNCVNSYSNSSSEVRIHLQHDVFHQLPHLEVNVNLVNRLANLTYHLNYSKISLRSHQVRANASVTSDLLPFSLQYEESSDYTDGSIQSNFVMNSTFLDYVLTVMKSASKKGIAMDGDFKYTIKLPYYTQESNIGVNVQMAPRRPPVCRIHFRSDDDPNGIQTTLMLLGPKKIQLTTSAISDPSLSTQEATPLFIWTIELTRLRVLQHTVDISEQGAMLVKGLLFYQSRQESHGGNGNTEHVTQLSLLPNVADDSLASVPYKSILETLENKLNMTLAQNPHNPDVKILQFLIGVVHTGTIVWRKSIPGTIYHTFHFDDVFAILSSVTSKMATEMSRQPPFVTRQFAKLYVHPQLRKILAGRRATMTMSLPFVWESFMTFPHGTMVDRELMEESRLSKVVSPYRDLALLVDGRWVKTFDGRWLDMQGFSVKSCVHLMAADVKKQRFVVLYSKTHGLTVLSKQNGIRLRMNGSVSSMDGQPISSLPFTTPDNTLSLTTDEGKLSLSISKGLARLTFDVRQNLVLFETAQQLNNASLGIWGTNNEDEGDDFRLSNGTISDSSSSLQDNYELTRNKKCLSSTHTTATSACQNNDNEADSICQNFFRRNTRLSTCALQIDPWPFKNLLCQSKECHGRSGCSVVKTYADICRHRGLDVQPSTGCESCQKDVGDNPKTDIIFVQSLLSGLADGNEIATLDNAVVNAFKDLSSFDVATGFVTYAGRGFYKQPRAHFINGRLFSPGGEDMPFSPSRMPTTTVSGSDVSDDNPEDAIKLAASFPFREGSTRFIILIHTPQVTEISMDEEKLADVLSRRNIHFLSATSRPDYTARGIVGVTYNGETIGHGKQDTDNSSFGILVKRTKGAWMTTGLLSNTHKDSLQALMAEISKNDGNKCFRDV